MCAHMRPRAMDSHIIRFVCDVACGCASGGAWGAGGGLFETNMLQLYIDMEGVSQV